MQNKSGIGEIINKYKTTYQKLQPIYSPALNERIHFNMAGFKHLIFKNRHRRKNSVIYTRMVLIPLIKPTIRKSETVAETRNRIEIIKGKETKVTYKALEAKVGKNSTKIKVIVKKVGNKGNYYFQSIMKYN